MYVKYNKNSRNPKVRRIYHYIYVILAHVFVLLLIFFIFCFKGCKEDKKPTSMKVNLVNLSSIQNNFPKNETKSENKKILKPKVINKKVIKTKPQKKIWKALDPSQITKSITKKVEKTPEHHYKPVNIDTSNFKSTISKNIKPIEYKNSFADNTSIISYYDEVSQYLYERWNQPGRTVMNDDFPSVEVSFSINKDGTVLKSSITKKSGILSMDSSVKELLTNITRLPKPHNGAMSFNVSLELTK